MARNFNGSTQSITVATGAFASQAWTFGSFAIIIRWGGTSGWMEAFGTSKAGGDGFYFGISDLNRWNVSFDGGTNSAMSSGPTSGTWYCVVVSKATGSAAPVFHIYDYSAGTWSHTNGGTSMGNGSGNVTGISIGKLASGSFEFWGGDIAAAGLFRAWVPTNAEVEGSALHMYGAAWAVAASKADKAAYWFLDQSVTTINVLDRSGGGANQSGGTLPGVSTVGVPLFGLGASPIVTSEAPSSGTAYDEPVSFTITSTSSVTDALAMAEGPATTITATTSDTALLAMAEGASSTVNATTSVVDTFVNGQSLLFDSNRDPQGNYEIYRLDLGVVTQLTNDPTYDSYWPQMSPDGTKIVFVRAPAGTHDTDTTVNSIWTMDRDGTNLVNILPDNVDSWTVMGHPMWAPDGSKIVLFGGFFDLYTCNPDGSGRTLITTGHVVTDPAYTPDGTKILYIANGGGFGNIFYVPAGGGTPVAVTTGSNVYYDPVADPATSGVVAFLEHSSGNPTGDWNIKTININGTGLATVIADGNINSRPMWAPDSTWLYFHRAPTAPGESGAFSLYKINKNGTGLDPISTGGGASTTEYPALRFAAAFSEPVSFTINATTSEVDQRALAEALSFTITSTSSVVDTLAHAEALAFTVNATTSLVDSLSHAEDLAFTINATSSVVDAFSAADNPTFTINATTSVVDTLNGGGTGYNEPVAFTINATSSVVDTQTSAEAPSFTINATSSVADAIAMVEALATLVAATTSELDSAAMAEGLSTVGNVTTSETDSRGMTEGLATAGAVTTSETDTRSGSEGTSLVIVTTTSCIDSLAGFEGFLVAIVASTSVLDQLTSSTDVAFVLRTRPAVDRWRPGTATQAILVAEATDRWRVQPARAE